MPLAECIGAKTGFPIYLVSVFVSDDELQAIPGNPPNLLALPTGCSFRDRCSEATEQCKERPPLWSAGSGRTSRCFQGIEGGEIVSGSTEGSGE